MTIRNPDSEWPSISTLSAPAALSGGGGVATVSQPSRPYTLKEGADSDPIVTEILEEDAQGMKTPLQLLKSYADFLNREMAPSDIDDKLDRLFLYGQVPPPLNGFYHGVTLGLRTGTDFQKLVEKVSRSLGFKEAVDPLQVIYGRLLSKTSPWAGKTFQQLSPERYSQLADSRIQDGQPTFLGINSFRKAHRDFVNNLAGHVLRLVIDMKEVAGPESKQRSWINAEGGLFIAQRARSVGPQHPDKEVLALNYRWKGLGNEFPNKLLVDELVQIAEGLYLGKLFYATSFTHLLRDFDPQVEKSDYKYRNFGYFLLMDDSWLEEKNQLFPDLAYRWADDLSAKLRTFRLDDSEQSHRIQSSLRPGKTVLHYLQDLSEGVSEETSSQARYLDKMQQLMRLGQRPDGIEGFLHGGVVAFQSSGFLKKLGRNILNDLWPALRPFSPWTGKAFSETTPKAIQKYIGEDSRHYRGVRPVILGSNTYRKELGLSLPASAFVKHLGKIGMAVEDPSPEEKEQGIDLKSFFFIAAFAPSVHPALQGKEVLQINYRWPEFHTMPPDNLCIDELVRIADGLYLGQLMYATNLKLDYDPSRDPVDYGYESFGYFMLMDDDWWALKEFIRFDTEK